MLRLEHSDHVFHELSMKFVQSNVQRPVGPLCASSTTECPSGAPAAVSYIFFALPAMSLTPYLHGDFDNNRWSIVTTDKYMHRQELKFLKK